MKRWIHAATSTSNVFDTSSTHTSYYNNFLNEKDLKYMQEAKNLTGHIEMMSPTEYFEECSENIFRQSHPSVESLKKQREYSRDHDGNKLVDLYKDAMMSGDVFPLCYLDYASSTQEGLHRMYAAGEAFGWDTKFPVLVVEPYDETLWAEQKAFEAAQHYCKYDFKDVVDEATDQIVDWNSPPPADVDIQLKEAIEQTAQNADEPHDIEVEVEVKDDQLLVYIVRVDDYTYDSPDLEKKIWLEDLFDMESENGQDGGDQDDEDFSDLDDSEFVLMEGVF